MEYHHKNCREDASHIVHHRPCVGNSLSWIFFEYDLIKHHDDRVRSSSVILRHHHHRGKHELLMANPLYERSDQTLDTD